MMPFLKPARMSAMIMAKHKPEGGAETIGEVAPDGAVQNPMLDAASDDLIRAVHAKDSAAVSMALKAAFSCCMGPDGDEGRDSGQA